MTKIYCLDAGVFINSWTKHYPIEVFPSVWKHLEGLCGSRRVCVPSDVASEVAVGDDGVWQWLKEHKKIIAKPNDDIILQMKEIVNRFPRLTAEGSTRSAADPWLIAHAFIKGGILVTEEQPFRNLNKPKIPDVCMELQMPYTNTVGLLRDTGYCAKIS